ncbi:hypothetical protein OPT61_g1302 [Boeremia exigua]|uniref:Uncharacterized protein n=1 Tax=Boeremia exigua TaxID=749465 RepID=A0ACC2IQZ4_9PLEO|nr:hypothetical protein OPT61_g1302 [Boeremia exigua]
MRTVMLEDVAGGVEMPNHKVSGAPVFVVYLDTTYVHVVIINVLLQAAGAGDDALVLGLVCLCRSEAPVLQYGRVVDNALQGQLNFACPAKCSTKVEDKETRAALCCRRRVFEVAEKAGFQRVLGSRAARMSSCGRSVLVTKPRVEQGFFGCPCSVAGMPCLEINNVAETDDSSGHMECWSVYNVCACCVAGTRRYDGGQAKGSRRSAEGGWLRAAVARATADSHVGGVRAGPAAGRLAARAGWLSAAALSLQACETRAGKACQAPKGSAADCSAASVRARRPQSNCAQSATAAGQGRSSAHQLGGHPRTNAPICPLTPTPAARLPCTAIAVQARAALPAADCPSMPAGQICPRGES